MIDMKVVRQEEVTLAELADEVMRVLNGMELGAMGQTMLHDAYFTCGGKVLEGDGLASSMCIDDGTPLVLRNRLRGGMVPGGPPKQFPRTRFSSLSRSGAAATASCSGGWVFRPHVCSPG